MRIVVCVKQVPDTDLPIKIDYGATDIEREGLPYVLNPYDRLAMEEASLIRERNGVEQVTVVSMGPPSATEVLRTCLAMGAHRAILLCDPALTNSDSYVSGVVLAKAIASLESQYDLILCGARSVDTNAGLAGATIAEILGISLVSEVVKIDVINHEEVRVHKKLERGNRAVIETSLPALLTVEAGINKPRYLKLRAILSARKEVIEQYDLKALNLSPEEVGLRASKTRVLNLSQPKPRAKKLFTPDSSLSGPERMRLIMSGGIAEKKTGGLLEGDTKRLAVGLVQFLREKRLVPGLVSSEH